MTEQPLRVLVADDHPLYRGAVAIAIQRHPEFELVAERKDGRAALSAIRELQPDVAVLDMTMPELDGMQVLHAVAREGLPTRVMFLSADAGGPVVYEALGAGAAAYLSKNAPVEEIREAVLTVGRGGTVIPAQAHESIAAEIRVRAAQARPLLTEREQQILSLAADGYSVTDMATRLHVSQGTVKSHLQNLYQKLGVSDRAAAVAEAMRRRLIE